MVMDRVSEIGLVLGTIICVERHFSGVCDIKGNNCALVRTALRILVCEPA